MGPVPSHSLNSPPTACHRLAHGQKSRTPTAIMVLERVREARNRKKKHRLRRARSCARVTAKSSDGRKVRAIVNALKGHLTKANVQLIQGMVMTHTSCPLNLEFAEG